MSFGHMTQQLNFLCLILQALKYCHDNDIIHRDIKVSFIDVSKWHHLLTIIIIMVIITIIAIILTIIIISIIMIILSPTVYSWPAKKTQLL